MSRFRPSTTGFAPRPASALAAKVTPVAAATPAFSTVRTVPTPAPATVAEEKPSFVQWIGFVFLCVYLVSNLANDWSIRFFGNRAYLSLVTGALLPVICMVGGVLFRGLKSVPGRWWAAFFVWMIITVPMSTWRGGSVDVLREFGTKNFPIFFYFTAFVVTTRQMRRLFQVMAFGGVVVLLSCYFFGDLQSGRLFIPGSIFFDNANDLALQLLISSFFFLFLLRSPNWLVKISGAVFMLAALLYMLKTGSRANFLSLGVCGVSALFLVRRKVALVSVMVLFLLMGAMVVPAQQWNRLFYIVFAPDEQPGDLNGDLESQIQRTDMLKYSLRFTLTHPIFGVGPGEFIDQVWYTTKSEGARPSSLGTHNTYTQVSSEMGLPALVLYLGTLISSFLLMFRLYKKTEGRKEFEELSSMALCIIFLLIVYSVSTIFHHVAYSRHLPTLAGLSAALWMMAARKLSPATTLLPFARPRA